jgi:hypothetical protein
MHLRDWIFEELGPPYMWIIMTVPDVYTPVTLMDLYLSEAFYHQKAYKELLAHVDDGHALTLDKVQNAIISFSRSRSARAFALTRSGDTPACTHGCPRCCAVPRGDTPGRTSRSSSRASSPRAHRTFRTVDDHEYWDNLGLDEEYHVFAAIFENNGVSPHQVLLDANIESSFLHDDAGSALSRAAAKFPAATDDSFQRWFLSLSPFLCPVCWERTRTFLSLPDGPYM